MARTRGMFVAEQNEASTTSTPVSSVPFPNSNAGSTLDTPATSGEEEEEVQFSFQKRSNENVKRTAGTRQKRSAESDGGNQSVSIKPPPKRRAIMKAVYVEIPVRSTNVSVGIALAPTVFD
jgi:hypothetical protein